MARPLGTIFANWTAPDVLDNGAWGGLSGDGSYYSSDNQYVVDSYLRMSAVFQCVNVLAETMGQLEFHAYERTDDGKQPLPSSDPLQLLLHDDPNGEQTAFEFRFQMQAWASVRSYAVAEVTWNRGRPVSMTPLHPSRVRVERLSNGRRRYQYREGNGEERAILADNIFRVPGKPVLDYASESFNLARSIQLQASRTMKNQIRPAGFISHDPGTFYPEDAKEKLKAAILANHGGPSRAGGILMLPEGLKWNQLGMTNEQAELVALVTASVEDVARWFNMPAYRLGILKAGTVSYASVEMQSLEFVVYTIMPWVQRWEQATRRDLIVRKEEQFAEFLMASLLRGTTKERYDAYAVALAWGWLSRNDIRRMENLNAVKGGDAFMVPLNMTTTADGQVKPVYASSPDSPAGRLLKLLASDAAGQVVRKETLAMMRAAEKHADAPEAWEEAVRDFYESHGDHVAAKLHIPKPAALSYARKQRDTLLAEGPTVLPEWQQDGLVDELTAHALEAV